MEKRKTIWISISIADLIKAAENKSSLKVEISYSQIMDQILKDNDYTLAFDVSKLVKNFSDVSNDDDEKLLPINYKFKQIFLQGLIEKKEGYKGLIDWKDALFLALDRFSYWINVPPEEDSDDDSSDDEDDDDDDDDIFDEDRVTFTGLNIDGSFDVESM